MCEASETCSKKFSICASSLASPDSRIARFASVKGELFGCAIEAPGLAFSVLYVLHEALSFAAANKEVSES